MKVKVKFAPEWGNGETNGKDTYCCSGSPVWLVKLPDDEEGHYFRKSDLEVIKEGQA